MTTSGLSTAAAGLHRWGLPRGLIVLLGGAAMVIIVAGIQGAAWLIGPAFMALIVVVAVAPARSWLRRKGWPAWATTLVVLLVYAILIGFALGIILSIAQVFLLSLLLFLSIESGASGERLASIAADRPPIAAALAHFARGTRRYLLVTTSPTWDSSSAWCRPPSSPCWQAARS